MGPDFARRRSLTQILKRLKRIYFLLLAISLLTGCADYMPHERPADGYIGDKLDISFSIDGISSTRADRNNVEESAIENVYLLFFTETGTLTAVVKGDINADVPGKLGFNIPLILKEGTDYRLLAIANADNFLPDGYNDYLQYIDRLNQEVAAERVSPTLFKKDALTSSSIRLLPMKGEATFSFSRLNGECHSSTSLIFRKLVSRIDIINEIPENINIVSAALCNWRDAVNVADPSATCGDLQGIFSDESAGTPDFVDFAEGNLSLTGSLYCFPSSSDKSEPGDHRTTSIILKAFWKDDTEASYYRVNIGEKDESVSMQPNMRYVLNIKSVKGRGSKTPHEAYESAEAIFVPFIPEQDVALIPLTDKRITIDHANRSIEIDAFDPDNFNGFIDIPFMLHIDSKFGNNAQVYVEYDTEDGLNWPLEGRISRTDASDYAYCEGSYGINGKRYLFSKSKGSDVALASTELVGVSLTLKNEEQFFISVGAMAPDDPPIERTITIDTHKIYGSSTIWGYLLEYKITVRPRQTIINDVVISDDDDNYWMIMDRNVQDSTTHKNMIGYDSDGFRRQAYNYSNLIWDDMHIPFKMQDTDTPMLENYHEESLGHFFNISSKDKFTTSFSTLNTERTKWLNNYIYPETATRRSPFYEDANIKEWIYPSESIIETMKTKIKAAKMRMYMISEIPAMINGEKIPVCCYLPYSFTPSNLDNTATHLYAACKDIPSPTPDGYVLIYPTPAAILTYKPTTYKFYGISRLVRPLADEELNAYKANYLGYGAPCRLRICHYDTYPYNQDW